MSAPTEPALLTTVTSLVSRSGSEDAVAQTFEQTFRDATQSSHHLGTLLLQQEDGVSFLVSQFRNREALEAWRASGKHQQMIASFDAHSVRELEMIEARAARLHIPSNSSGPKWKVLASTWIVIFPILLALNVIYGQIGPELPRAMHLAVTSFVLAVIQIWFVSPLLQRMTRTWRLANEQMKIDMVEVKRS
jgi:antibiotic biosynthesis monooxygenase (ABM) superfamily enzyme